MHPGNASLAPVDSLIWMQQSPIIDSFQCTSTYPNPHHWGALYYPKTLQLSSFIGRSSPTLPTKEHTSTNAAVVDFLETLVLLVCHAQRHDERSRYGDVPPTRQTIWGVRIAVLGKVTSTRSGVCVSSRKRWRAEASRSAAILDVSYLLA
ncbi:hypothetical protein BC834DRAFT_886048 [Gloeopeniophorella convolvens]|nr:hypothetical protein BC834DRAFT_886048 [Gloeopeniophorella convolvens]